MGYTGRKRLPGRDGNRAVCLSEKKPPHRRVTMKEKAKNHELFSDRIIVEDYFRRSTTLWVIMSIKYGWEEGLYDVLFRMSMAVTNDHIIWQPIRQEDGKRYSKVKNRLYSIGDDISRKRRMAQEKYREKHRHGMLVQFSGTAQPDDETIM